MKLFLILRRVVKANVFFYFLGELQDLFQKSFPVVIGFFLLFSYHTYEKVLILESFLLIELKLFQDLIEPTADGLF